MNIQAILFDINGTLIDINTDEGNDEIYRGISHLLTYQGISRNRLQLYPGVLDVLNELRNRYKLAAISDAQSAWCLPEIRAVGIAGYFDPIIVSGDFGYRKPDARLFSAALTALQVAPENVLFVGNDMFRDIFPANLLGIKSVFFSSNQGGKQAEGAKPDYVIYQFSELRQAVEFFERS